MYFVRSITCLKRNGWRYFSAKYNVPLSSNDLTRAGGIASFMRLPVQTSSQGLDVCFVGIPLDAGASNRPGCRYGPRNIRAESCLLRPYNSATGMSPFDFLQVADIGDVPVTIFNLKQAVKDIKEAYSKILSTGTKPLTMGGDHTITYPILQAVKGFRVVQIEECWHKSLSPLMKVIREQIGDGPVYVSLDIDALDPAYAPGTGTPEIAGLTPSQMLEIIRGCHGLDIIGGDLVEVSPPYDFSGNTALLGANLLFELLCVVPSSSSRQ